MPETRHIPVMVPEVLSALEVKPGGFYIDANLGEGGHTEAILLASAPEGAVLGIDSDTAAISSAVERLSGSPELAGHLTTANANFRDIESVSTEHGRNPGSVDGVLFDLGLSSLQLDTEERGFSFRRSDPLDMRFDVRQTLTAADIVNTYGRDELADVIYQYGEERASRRVAAANPPGDKDVPGVTDSRQRRAWRSRNRVATGHLIAETRRATRRARLPLS